MDKEALIRQAVIPVVAKPKAPKTCILGVRNGALHVAIAAPPQDGKANRVLEKFLSTLTGKQCVITSGLNSRKKLVTCR